MSATVPLPGFPRTERPTFPVVCGNPLRDGGLHPSPAVDEEHDHCHHKHDRSDPQQEPDSLHCAADDEQNDRDNSQGPQQRAHYHYLPNCVLEQPRSAAGPNVLCAEQRFQRCALHRGSGREFIPHGQAPPTPQSKQSERSGPGAPQRPTGRKGRTSPQTTPQRSQRTGPHNDSRNDGPRPNPGRPSPPTRARNPCPQEHPQSPPTMPSAPPRASRAFARSKARRHPPGTREPPGQGNAPMPGVTLSRALTQLPPRASSNETPSHRP